MPDRAPSLTPAIMLGLLAVVMPVLQAYSPPIVVPVLAVAAVGIVAGGWRQLPPPRGWLIPCLAAVAGFGLLSALWAVDARFALLMAAKLLGLFVCCVVVVGAALSLDDRRRALVHTTILLGFLVQLANVELALITDGRTVTWVHALYSLVGGVQRPVVMPVFLDTAMTLIGLLVWPALAVTLRRFGHGVAIGLFVLGFLVIRQGGSFTAVIAYGAGALAFLSACWLPRITALLCGWGTALWILSAPFLLRPDMTAWIDAAFRFVEAKAHSWEHRRAIWGFVIDRIHERPVFGWGLGSSRAIPGGHTLLAPGVEILPLHPHDAALQLWLELGLVGALLGAAFFLCLARTVRRSSADRTDFALAIALIVTATINAMASYNLWHEWWLTFLIAAAGLLIAARPRAIA
jgi:O-antigen ligase